MVFPFIERASRVGRSGAWRGRAGSGSGKGAEAVAPARYASYFLSRTEQLVPPKPKELLRA